MINNIYTQCKNADEAKFEEMEVINTWTTSGFAQVKKLDEQRIVLKLTLKGVKNERP